MDINITEQKMRIAQITNSSKGSIGTISILLSDAMFRNGIDNRIYTTSGPVPNDYVIRYADDLSIKWNSLKSHVFGNYGFNSNAATSRLIASLSEYKPDLVHIHNIHGHDVNMERLFEYLSDCSVPVIYTFHDCWAFTGYCPHYAYAGCDQWKTECRKCPLRRRFSFVLDSSNRNFHRKKDALSRIEQLTIVTPSSWLKEQVSQSFLSQRECIVINNGIDTDQFRPVVSDKKDELAIQSRYVALSAANRISSRKGIEDLAELAKNLPADHALVLLGLSKDDITKLPEGIIGLPRTESREELAELYSMADVFVNATHEDTFPTVNMEALACGTPVVTYDTGGSPEIIDADTGRSVPEYDVDALCSAVVEVAAKKPDMTDACRKRVLNCFTQKTFTENYLALYQKILSQ